MSAAVTAGLLNAYAGEIAPFVRHDDLYGNILLPSVIGNQKGRYRAVINRRAFFLYKGWALSSPESLLFLKRQEEEVLQPLSEAILSADRRSLVEYLDSLNTASHITISSLIETLFRFLVVQGEDERALRLVVMMGDLSGLFLQRCAVILCMADPSLSRAALIEEWSRSVFDATVLTDLTALVGDDAIRGFRLPGSTPLLAALYYKLFEPGTGVDLLDDLEHAVGDLHLALDRRSGQAAIFYLFQALLSSGRLFAAFLLSRRCERAGGDHRLPAAMFEEWMRIALVNDRLSFYERMHRKYDDAMTERFRFRLFAITYGQRHAHILEQLLHRSLLDENPPVASGSFLTAAHDHFEDLFFGTQPGWFLQGRRQLALYAGEDCRLRALLGTIYEEADPHSALEHYEVSSYPPLRQYRALRLREKLGTVREKRELRLRKMLESSPGGREPGSGDGNERG